MLTAGTTVTATLFVLGLVWVAEVVRRLPRDVAELRSADASDRTIIVSIWIATGGIAAWVAAVVVRVASGIGAAF